MLLDLQGYSDNEMNVGVAGLGGVKVSLMQSILMLR